MCHSENRHGNKQNKNRCGLQDCGHHSENRNSDRQIKPLELLNCGQQSENGYSYKQIRRSKIRKMQYTEEMILQSKSGYCMPFEEQPCKEVSMTLGYGEQTYPFTGE